MFSFVNLSISFNFFQAILAQIFKRCKNFHFTVVFANDWAMHIVFLQHYWSILRIAYTFVHNKITKNLKP